MQREIQLTADGSHTIRIPAMGVTYHSMHGAVQESMHVFINAGLEYTMQQWRDAATIRVFEMGFGTGLNALLTLRHALLRQQPVYYFAVEQHPLSLEEALLLNYPSFLNDSVLQAAFTTMHGCNWGEEMAIHRLFTLQKSMRSLQQSFTAVQSEAFDVIYYDAFDPSVQPELWIRGIFEKLCIILHNTGTLVTYCSKGDVRRAMQSAGFTTEKLPGPPGKKEMLRAVKK